MHVWRTPALSSQGRFNPQHPKLPIRFRQFFAALLIFASAVIATFMASTGFAQPVSYSVQPFAGAGSYITPSQAQSVAAGATFAFQVGGLSHYTTTVGGTCGGTLAGTTYTTNPITATCRVIL